MILLFSRSCYRSLLKHLSWSPRQLEQVQHTFVSPSAFSRRAVVSYWRKYVHEVLVNRLGGLSLPRKSVVRLTDRPDMTLDVYRGRKTTMQQPEQVQLIYYQLRQTSLFSVMLLQSQLPYRGSVADLLLGVGYSPVLHCLHNSHSCTVLSNILSICCPFSSV